MLEETSSELHSVRQGVDSLKTEVNKKITSIFKEIEKLQLAVERKVNVDLFNERVESKADKQMVLNAVINKVSKIELEQFLNSKVDRRDFD